MPRKLLLTGALLGAAALAMTGAGAGPGERAAHGAPQKPPANAKKKGGKAPPPAEALPEESTPEAAQLHEDVGQEHFDAGRFAKALEEFEAAERVRSTPHRRMMTARCLEQLGRIPEALAIYKVVAARSPDPFDVDEAKRRIKVLTPKPSEKEMGADPFADSEPPPAPPAPPAEAEPPPAKATPAKKAPARAPKSGR